MGNIYILREQFKNAYCGKIRGYGEIYEIESVEYLRKRLWNLYGNEYPYAVLYLEPKDENSLQETLNKSVEEIRDNVLDAGITDRPFWGCKPKENGKAPNSFLMGLAKIVFKVIVRFESWYIWGNDHHISYVLLKKDIR